MIDVSIEVDGGARRVAVNRVVTLSTLDTECS